jgi:hypothetical protein
VTDAANGNGVKTIKQVRAEIKDMRERNRARMAIVRDAAERWQRLADSLRR